jgi:hypothetical protein
VSVNGTFKFTRIKDVEMTMTATMTVGEWQELHGALDGSGPYHFNRLIRELLAKADKEIWQMISEDAP